jgi:flavodoxin
MMRVLVTYFSQTGNTEKVAEAIFDEVSRNHDSKLKKLKEVKEEKLDDYDLIFIGSACHSSDVAPPVKKFLENLPDTPSFKIAGFVTHATYTADGPEYRVQVHEQWSGKCLSTLENSSKAKKIQFLGFFSCMGKPSPAIEQFIAKEVIPDEEQLDLYMKEVSTHPNDVDLEDARAFCRSVLERV